MDRYLGRETKFALYVTRNNLTISPLFFRNRLKKCNFVHQTVSLQEAYMGWPWDQAEIKYPLPNYTCTLHSSLKQLQSYYGDSCAKSFTAIQILTRGEWDQAFHRTGKTRNMSTCAVRHTRKKVSVSLDTFDRWNNLSSKTIYPPVRSGWIQFLKQI